MNKFQFHISFKFILLLVAIICLSNAGLAQKQGFFSDSVHSAKKATIYSAILPGLGQVYNKKAWKVPIVYAAIGGCLVAAISNDGEYDKSRNELIYRKDYGSSRDQNFFNFSDTELLARADFYRKWRDNMYIFTGVAYILNLIDANVDAHLFNFSVDENLSMNVVPYTYSQEFKRPVAGLSFTFSFR